MPGASAEALGVTWRSCPSGSAAGACIPWPQTRLPPGCPAVRALAEAGERAGTLVTVCSACHHVLKRTNEDFKRDETFRDRANRYLELPRPYEGQTRWSTFWSCCGTPWGLTT